MVCASGALAQAPATARRIAVLLPGSPAAFRSRLEALRDELKRLGYVEGRDVRFDVRFAEDRTERLDALANEVVALAPAVIVTATSAGIRATSKVTSTIPIIFATGTLPVEQGFVSSLRRPGRNVTGVMTHIELASKCVELAREVLPRAKRLAMLAHESDPAHAGVVRQFVSTAEKLGFDPVVARVRRADELDGAFRSLQAQRADALVLAVLAFSVSHAKDIIDHSLRMKLPVLSPYVEGPPTEALLSYGTARTESYRRAAALVDKILRGANPADLPVEQPERFHLVVNLRTAKAIGVTVPEVTLLRATRVIE